MPESELEPHMAAAVVDAPAAGQRGDQPQPAAADLVRASLANLDLEARSLVDDLAPHHVLIDREPQPDRPHPVDDGVAHEL